MHPACQASQPRRVGPRGTRDGGERLQTKVPRLRMATVSPRQDDLTWVRAKVEREFWAAVGSRQRDDVAVCTARRNYKLGERRMRASRISFTGAATLLLLAAGCAR